jgi:ribonuclease P protein component
VRSSLLVGARAARFCPPSSAQLLTGVSMSTIRSSREIDRVFRTAHRATSSLVIALAAPTPPGRDRNGRVAVVAGKKLGGAIVRNRAKRVLRAAAREAGAPWPEFDIVLIARPRTPAASSHDVAREVRATVKRAGVES